jgi:hypothetical protein
VEILYVIGYAFLGYVALYWACAMVIAGNSYRRERTRRNKANPWWKYEPGLGLILLAALLFIVAAGITTI